MSVNIYLMTEDLTIKTKEFSFYEVLEKIPYEISLENEEFEKETDKIDNFIYENKMISFSRYDVFDNGLLNDLYKYEFRVIKRFFEKHNFKELTTNPSLLEWFIQFEYLFEKYKSNEDIFIYFDIEQKLFIVFKLNEGEKDIYYPAKFLPVIDDRLFNYGISNIQRMYFPDMNIGNVTSDIYTCLFVDKYKKEDIFKETDYKEAITLNQLINFIEKYTNLNKAHSEDNDFFETRKETFKEQLNLLKPYQKEHGNKKVFSFIIA